MLPTKAVLQSIRKHLSLNHIETSLLKRFAILLTDFYMIIDFSERYFRTDFNDIFSLSVVIIANFKRIQIIRKEV